MRLRTPKDGLPPASKRPFSQNKKEHTLPLFDHEDLCHSPCVLRFAAVSLCLYGSCRP